MPIEQPKVFFLIKVSGENSSGIITQKSAGSPIAGRKLGSNAQKVDNSSMPTIVIRPNEILNQIEG